MTQPLNASPESTFTGGFESPVFEAQSVFRALMNGMARPGRIETVDPYATAPGIEAKALAAIALTLFDHDTPVFIGNSLKTSGFPGWLSFQTGAPLVENRLDAMFAVFTKACGFPEFEGFALGSDAYPDRSTTVIAEIESLSGGPDLLAEGPGILGVQALSPLGLPENFLKHRAENQTLFPRGIDLVLVAEDGFISLPRTTRLKKREG